jgi:hypothetical protein
MKGYVYLDAGGNLHVRNQEYIDNEDPGFFQRNKSVILLVWKFDTENEGMMFNLMSSFSGRQLPHRIVKEFCDTIKFDLKAFMDKNKKAPLIFAPPTDKQGY